MRKMLLVKLAIHSMSAHTQEAYDIPLMKVSHGKDILLTKEGFPITVELLIRQHNLAMDSHLFMLMVIIELVFIIKIRTATLEQKIPTELTQMRSFKANQSK